MLSRLLFVFFLSSCSAFGQSVVTIVSGDDNSPVALASIVGFSGADSIFSAISDNRGAFSIPEEQFSGNQFLIIRAKASGYELLTDTVFRNQSKNIVLFRSAASLDEFVVTGQLGQTNIEDAVQRVRIIDRKALDAKGAVNLRDALQNELNIRISQDQVLGSGMSLQGLNGQNVKILIDGVPVIGRVDGEIDLSQINLSTIERIEIVEGPSSVSYGSNALAGTINLISKKKLRKRFNLQTNAYYETVGNYNLDALVAISLKKSQIQLTGQRNYFDGWSGTDPFVEFPEEKIADSARFQTWKPKMQYQAGIKWIIPVKRMVFTPFADYFFESIHNKGLPRAPYFNTAFDDYYVTNRANTGLQLSVPIRERWKAQGVIAYNYYERTKNTYLLNLNTLDKKLTLSPTDQDTTEFTAFMSRMSFIHNSKNERFNYEVGYDINHESAAGRRIANAEQEITESAVFSNVEMQLGKLMLKPGLRATYNSTYYGSITPAFNAKYTTTKWNYRLGVASGFRSPGIKELYLDFVDINHNIVGNPDLKPERSIHSQLWAGTKRKLGKHPFNIDVSTYYQKVTDRITLALVDETGTSYSYFNLDYFESAGAQASVEYRPGNHSFRLGGSLIGTKSNLTTDKFAYSPEITFTATVLWKKPQVSFSTFYKYTGRVQVYLQSVEGIPYLSYIEDYNMLDLNISKPFFKNRIVGTIGGKNLLDVKTIGVSNGDTGAHSGGSTSTPIAWGRSIYLKLQINLSSKK